MQAVIFDQPGGAEKLRIGEWETPQPDKHEILIKVAATALNRADILQREGKYPPPKGSSPILGLEVSGEVVETGSEAKRWKQGDLVFGLIPGGGYAQYAVIHEDMAMPVPDSLSLAEAAAIPEVSLTAYQALSWLAYFKKGEKLLIHAGASGVGTAAIQLAREMGAGKIIVTASASKHPLCLELGANLAIDYQNQDFEKVVNEQTDGKGVDVIIDFIAAPYFNSNINCLGMDGRLVLLAILGGVKVEELNLLKLLSKRLQITASTLRSRSLEYQIQLTKDFSAFALPLFEKGILKPVVDSMYSWKEVADAHTYMESNQNSGKIVLVIKEN
ncbi:tumor protein p53-inducible protein 3 [Catalinimonas alkaloidigena]|uniref:NAD(P)H-quinone oxidoreductase n=1 Tax=Catalinimonas alkaloidigena TaxID=1075417 RepID=UPI002404C584|nr:NAD(P)H-quinone oxidoreductase [Catalinimonas alkaloidigena]MDF9801121.1 tumor protein p53-inducible protein 3 [Catalinimonas alkaloidigena]